MNRQKLYESKIEGKEKQKQEGGNKRAMTSSKKIK